MKVKLGAKPYHLPMPCAIIGAQVDGKSNFMLCNLMGMLNYTPPVVGVSLYPAHYTTRGILANKTFSVNIPSESMMAKADYSGLVSGHREDKSKLFEVFYGELKTAPLISECPISIECSLQQWILLGDGALSLGKVKEVYCDENVISKFPTGNGPDVEKIKPFILTYADNSYHSIGPKIGNGWQAGRDFKKANPAK